MDKRYYILIIIVILIHTYFAIARLTTTGVTHYRLLRLHTLVMTGTAMIFSSLYVWKRVNIPIRCFFPVVNEHKRRLRMICMKDVAQTMLVLFLVLSHLAFFFYYICLGPEPNFLAIISLTFVAAYAHLFFFLLIADLFLYFTKLIHEKVVRNSVHEYLRENRQYHIFLALILTVLFVLGGLYTTQSDPVITEANIEFKKFKSNNDPGMKLALLSDIHIGPTVGKSRMKRIVEMTNNLKPDVIAIAGDLADGLVFDLGDAAKPLCELSAPGGVFFATGNHEYMHGDVTEWFEFLNTCNITILHNENRMVHVKGREYCIAGADDLFAEKAHMSGHKMDLHKALSGCKPESGNILLAHQPNAARRVIDNPELSKTADLILSGHTHAGQMYLFVPIVHIANAFVRGLYHDISTDTYVYVSAGVNYFGPPIKIFGGCEIIQININ